MEDRITQIQRLIDRMRVGDAQAHKELVGESYERLRCLTVQFLDQDFPPFDQIYRSQTVVDEAAFRFLETLDVLLPSTASAFCRLSAFLIRRTLVKLAWRSDRQEGHPILGSIKPLANPDEPATSDPSAARGDRERPARRTSFHEMVDELEKDERAVVELHWYQGLSQDSTAALLGFSQSKVSRLWRASVPKLPALLK